jgi:hypothetical protein
MALALAKVVLLVFAFILPNVQMLEESTSPML